MPCGPCKWTGFGRGDDGEKSRVSMFERLKGSEKKEKRAKEKRENDVAFGVGNGIWGKERDD